MKLPRRICSPGLYKADLICGKVDGLFVDLGDLGEGNSRFNIPQVKIIEEQTL